jgi:hypothetical protein
VEYLVRDTSFGGFDGFIDPTDTINGNDDLPLINDGGHPGGP